MDQEYVWYGMIQNVRDWKIKNFKKGTEIWIYGPEYVWYGMI